MIGKLKGIVDSVDEEALILDVNGVGYLVSASARTLRALPAAGQPAELLIETQVREDAIRLFGFLTAGERDWFRLLQSVQGVGAKVALGILGALSAEALSAAVARQDKAMMARAPGVGPKLAARLVLELKDKAPALGVADFGHARSGFRARAEARQGGGGRGPRAGRPRLRPAASGRRRGEGFPPARAGGRDRRADPRGLEGIGAVSRFYDMMIDRRRVKKMSAIATVSSKFQISIPKEVREQLAWRPGQKVAFIAKAEGFLIVPVPKREELVGIARGANTEGYRDRNDRY